MIKIDEDTLRKLQKKYGFKFGRVKGTDIINILAKPSPRFEVIDMEAFLATLNKRKLSVYKSEKGDFLKIMKNH
jgi:hypothetical protein